MGAASSLFNLVDSERWDEVKQFLLDRDIANETKIENLRYRDKYRGSPLHTAIYRKAPIYVIVLMLDIGGDDLLTELDHDRSNALHHAAIAGSPVEVLTLMTRVGGKKILTAQDRRGKIPICYTIDRFGKPNLRSFQCFLKEGLLQEVGGKHGMGGMFIKDRFNHSTYDFLTKRLSWENIIRTVNDAACGQPFLHGAIGNLSKEALDIIIERFPWSISARDSDGRLPIHVAADRGLTWEEGMETLVLADEDSIETFDSKVTGLYPFALAAEGPNSDLNTVYNLVHRRVNLLFTEFQYS